MHPKTPNEFCELVLEVKQDNPDWRLGQTYFNCLYATRADLAAQIRGTHRDPFNLDERIPEFLLFILENW